MGTSTFFVWTRKSSNLKCWSVNWYCSQFTWSSLSRGLWRVKDWHELQLKLEKNQLNMIYYKYPLSFSYLFVKIEQKKQFRMRYWNLQIKSIKIFSLACTHNIYASKVQEKLFLGYFAIYPLFWSILVNKKYLKAYKSLRTNWEQAPFLFGPVNPVI